MERQKSSLLQNFDDSKSDILKKRLLKTTKISSGASLAHKNSQQNALMNNLRLSSSMLVTSVQAPQSSIPITHNLVTHSIAPVKLHPGSSPYPLQLSTVHVPVQIPGSNSNINVPVQLSGPANSVPFQLASSPLQVSGTTTVPVQITTSDGISVPLQIPTAGQNIHLAAPQLPSLPLLQSTGQPLHSSIIHVHMGGNQRPNMEGDMNGTNSQMADKMKQNNMSSIGTLQVPTSSVQVSSSSTAAPVHLTLPSPASAAPMRGSNRPVPHVVYIQTPSGLKPVSSTEVITQASSSGNPPQIIVRRPVGNSGNIHLISNVNSKTNIAPKATQNKSSVLASNNISQPIVIQKPKTDKMMVPVSIATGGTSKQAIAYLGPVKKSNPKPEGQSILIPNNQTPNSNANQKLYLTPMNVQKIPNTKFVLPVNATMASKGPIINLQISNGQLQNDPQGNITVMRDSALEPDVPPLQPLAKGPTGKEYAPRSPPPDQAFPVSITGSRAESTGEQEYTLSIPETSVSMNDDVYTVSIADEEGGQAHEKSFTLSIPETGKSLLSRSLLDRSELTPVPAPAILRRSNSDGTERKTASAGGRRRVSLCDPRRAEPAPAADDHRVPSLFCDEQLDKDLDAKPAADSEPEDCAAAPPRAARASTDAEEDPPGLLWHDGVAQLQGSELKFQTNEFGLIDVIEDASDREDGYLNHAAKYHTPLKQRAGRGGAKPASPEDLYRCAGCGCHGMAAEFITPDFCSLTCQAEVQKSLQKRRDREKVELTKRRNKMKKLLMRKQLPDDAPEPKDERPARDEAAEPEAGGKYPWMCGSSGFSWMRYLETCKAKAAPVKLFKDPFPYNRNGFKVNMRLEAIDPRSPSQWCVAGVAEVQGYRLRLHVDESADVHDYWVNADSADLFPAGWCERNGRALRPPPSAAAAFSWPLYLKQIRAVAAPRHLFPHLSNTMVKPNGFRTGMKLEALDRAQGLLCVASVADMLDNRLLINFDSWDEMYDYWVDPASPYIHPVGHAAERGLELTPPHYYKDPRSFSWEAYLSESGAAAAPARAFKTRAPLGFRAGMKLEVVDPRVPFLVRVATVSGVRGHQVRVSFDGWPERYAAWLDDDSPDLHPVGWCLKTGHPLEPPMTEEELAAVGGCGVAGCRGLGSLRGGPHKQHSAASACPYRAEPATPPRRTPAPAPPPVAAGPGSRPPKSVSAHSNTPTSDAPREKAPRGRPPKHRRVEEVSKRQNSDDESVSSKRSRASSGGRWTMSAAPPAPAPPAAPAPRDLTPRLRPLLDELQLAADATAWSESDVSRFAVRMCGAGAGAATAAARLSGPALLLASRGELAAAGLRLGPAVKLHAAVRELRRLCS